MQRDIPALIAEVVTSMFPLQIFGSVGPEQENSVEDISRVALALSEVGVAAGVADVHEAAHTGQWNDSLDKSVKAFQDNQGLVVDGVLVPRGPTESAINRTLRMQPEAEHQSERAQDAVLPTGDGSKARSDFWSRSGGEAEKITVAASMPPASRPNPYLIARGRREGETAGDNWWRGPHDWSSYFDRSEPEKPPADAPRNVAVAKATLDLPPRQTARRDAPADPQPPVAAENEARILTGRGYTYRADPMGRIGWGDWVGPDGAVLAPDRKAALLDDGALGHTPLQAQVDPVAPSAGPLEGYQSLMREVVRIAKPEHFDDPQAYLDALQAVMDDGVIPANDGKEFIERFAHIIMGMRGLGAKRMRLPGALVSRDTFPAELTRRLDGVLHDRTRFAVEQTIKGSIPERKSTKPGNDFVLNKLGTHENMIADFWAAVRLSGGRNIEYVKPGVYRYTAPNGTVFMTRRYSRSGEPTNDFHIEPPGSALTKIKIRYTTKLDDLKISDE